MISKHYVFLFCILLSAAFVSSAYANEDDEEVIYVEPSFANYAKTYWRLNKFNIEDDAVVDNFMFITECDLYKEFAHDEFEWKSVRKATRDYLQKNKNDFPIHYQFVQPISLGEYDFEKKGFWIAEEHRLEGVTRFNMPSNEYGVETCMKVKKIPSYPKSLALELTRPFTLEFFPYDEERAQALIKERMKNYENLHYYEKGRNTYLGLREVYMVTNVKMFAYKPGVVSSEGSYDFAKVLGIMEDMTIYSDRELTDKMYEEDYRRKRRSLKKDF